MSAWQPIETAPKKRKIDIWAKTWVSRADAFLFERFPDCRWDEGDSMCNRLPCWSGLPTSYFPTHWMERPEPPK